MREFTLTSNAATTTTGLSVVGATTLNFINPPASPSVDIGYLRHWVGQAANVLSANQRIQLATQASVFPTVVGATPRRLKLADPNASAIVSGTAGAAGTCGINASAEGAGTKTLWWDDTFNVVNGYLKVNTPDEVDVIPSGYASGCNFWFPTLPATLTGWNWGQNFREIA